MCSTIAARLLLIAVVVIVLAGQMSNCDNAVAAPKANASSPAQSGAVDAAKKSAEPAKTVVDEKVQPQPVKPVTEEKEPQPIQNAAPAVPAAPAVVVADVNANKYARGNLLNNETEIPGTIQTAFYVFVAFGLVVIFYISYRSYRKFRLRSSRAARRYGTRGNHSRHELQPLPSAIELESEDEENTVFDRISSKN